jgi:hypothetical protein
MTDWNCPLLLLLESFNYDGTWVLGSKMFTSAELKQWIVCGVFEELDAESDCDYAKGCWSFGIQDRTSGSVKDYSSILCFFGDRIYPSCMQLG